MNNGFVMDKVSSDMVNMMAKQLGAVSIKNRPAHINIYEFKIGEDLILKYMLDLRKDHSMYLHRVHPYPLVLGKFYGETDVIEFMKRDLAKFENAHKSENLGKFLELAENLTQFNREIEQLFLNRNVPDEAFKEFFDEMISMRKTIDQIARDCPLLYDDEKVIDIDHSEV